MVGDLATNYHYYKINNYFKINQNYNNIIYMLIMWYNKTIKKRINQVFNYPLIKRLQGTLEIYFTAINPDSKLKFTWDFYILVMIITNIFFIPLNISFSTYNVDFSLSPAIRFIFEDLSVWSFIIDFSLNFNTAYYKKGKLNDKKIIAKNHFILIIRIYNDPEIINYSTLHKGEIFLGYDSHQSIHNIY